MIYICSDIHGLYDRYEKMLAGINLSENDTLYVLGDMIDRGEEGIRILQDMMKRDNIIPFMGNHEHMMLMHLYGYDRQSWLLECNGGMETLKRYEALAEDEKKAILDYLENSWIVKHLDIQGHHYTLSHIGIFTDAKDRKADFRNAGTDVYDLQKMVWGQVPYEIGQINHCPEERCPVYYVTGHIITRRWDSDMEEDEAIYSSFPNGCKYIDLDCGCAMGSGLGRLAVLTIDETTGEFDPDNILYFK